VEGLLSIIAEFEDGKRSLKAELRDDQVASLKGGGSLIIKAADGKMFEVPFTIESP
jgi:hypothetical protein